MLGQLNSTEIDAVLQSQALGRIACHARGRTYIVPISYAYDGRRILGHSTTGLKVNMMRENPEVCFEVEDVSDLANWRSVIVWGTYRELSGTDAAAALGLLVAQFREFVTQAAVHGSAAAFTPSASSAEGTKETIVFAIDLNEKSGRFERCAEQFL